MPSLKDIRKRIVSVKNTQKITSAMKLVSASYFAKASQLVIQNRPYSHAFDSLVNKIATSRRDEIVSPFIGESKMEKVLLVLVSTDRGLCGGLNANNFKNALQWIKLKQEQKITVDIVTWGKKAQIFGRKLSIPIVGSSDKVLEKPTHDKAKQFVRGFIDRFLVGEYDHIYFAYPEFKSAMEQLPKIVQIMPIPSFDEKQQTNVESQKYDDLLVEPFIGEMIDRLLEKKIVMDIFRILINCAASEHGARMTAMDSATNNAGEVIKQLTIKYNRARQAAITKELIEIVSGAESLN